MADEITEPENATVDDWFGQNAERDAEVADQVVAESGGDLEEAERKFDERADGQERYEAGHPDDQRG